MGIKKFFGWFKNQFNSSIYRLNKKTFHDLEPKVCIDNFMIDLNGLFHSSAQRIFQYGDFKPMQKLFGPPSPTIKDDYVNRIKVYQNVCDRIEYLKNVARPKKRFILCIDGPAPLSKQNQQRQRRFRSAFEKKESTTTAFDSNCMTPGTVFMDELSKYIHSFITKKIKSDETWKCLEIVFSDEKVAGEGEQKLVSYVRKHGNTDETFCIHGADADIIMLALATHFPKFYILRDDMMSVANEFYVVDINQVRQDMATLLDWSNDDNSTYAFDAKNAINDFILMCFMVGNDFLPHIPSIEIVQGSIDILLDVYRKTCFEHGHLTGYKLDSVYFEKKSLKVFLDTVALYEKTSLEEKMQRKEEYFPSPILESRSEFINGKWVVDIERYRRKYYRDNMGLNLKKSNELEQVCHQYLEGVQWVLSYYTSGVPNWKWKYPHHYSPFCFDLARYIDTFSFVKYKPSEPSLPFIQLLSVLPPTSAQLLPKPLCELLNSDSSPLAKYCPKELKIDKSGCKQEWEAIVILPMIDYDTVEKEYSKRIKDVDEKEQQRNVLGSSLLIKWENKRYLVESEIEF